MTVIGTVAIVLLISGLALGNDPEFFVWCSLALGVISKLRPRTALSAVAFAGALQLWLNASAQGIYYSFVEPQGLLSLPSGFALREASLLCLGGATAFALGMTWVASQRNAALAAAEHSLVLAAHRMDPNRLFIGYAAFFLMNVDPLRGLFFIIPGLTHAMLFVLNLKWFFFFLLCACAIQGGRGRQLFLLCVMIEVFSGVTGFWGSFKDFAYVLMIAALLWPQRLRLREFGLIILMGAALLYLALAWTAIKADYRAYISQGQGQVVTVSLGDRLGYLSQAFANLSAQQIEEAVESLVQRVGYVRYFAEVMEYIPRHRPHGEGELLWKSFQHVLMPRLFFPDKPALNDSKITAEYTGKAVSGVEQATSINIGYPGEIYADFGAFGTLGLSLILGMIYQWMTGWLARHAPSAIIGMALAVTAYCHQVGATYSLPKLMGALVTTSVMAVVIATWFSGILEKYIRPRRVLRT